MVELFIMVCLMGPPGHILPPCEVQFHRAQSCESAMKAALFMLDDPVEVGSEDPYLQGQWYEVVHVCQYGRPGSATVAPWHKRDA